MASNKRDLQGNQGRGPIPAKGPADIGAERLDPATSGDAANIGQKSERREPIGGPAGGGTLRSNPGDAGADAGEGSIDATDATSVTGEPGMSPADLSEDTMPAGERDPGYRKDGASGALGPEDIGPDAGIAPDPTGPAADYPPPGFDKPMGTGHGAKPIPTAGTNRPGPADEKRQREAPKPGPNPPDYRKTEDSGKGQ